MVRTEFVREAVEDELGQPSRGDEAGAAQVLEVLRGVGDGEPRQLGQRLHAALALGNELKQLKAVLVGDRLRDGGKLDVEVALGIPT